MTNRLYLLPVVRLFNVATELTRDIIIQRVPKYIDAHYSTPLAGLEGLVWRWENYFMEDFGVVVADTDTTQNNILTSQSDIILVPALDNTIPNITVRDTIRSFWEARGMPGDFVTVGQSYRVMMRIVTALIRWRNTIIILGGSNTQILNLDPDLTYAEMTTRTQGILQSAAQIHGLDITSLLGTSTVRDILVTVGAQFASVPFPFESML